MILGISRCADIGTRSQGRTGIRFKSTRSGRTDLHLRRSDLGYEYTNMALDVEQ